MKPHSFTKKFFDYSVRSYYRIITIRSARWVAAHLLMLLLGIEQAAWQYVVRPLVEACGKLAGVGLVVFCLLAAGGCEVKIGEDGDDCPTCDRQGQGQLDIQDNGHLQPIPYRLPPLSKSTARWLSAWDGGIDPTTEPERYIALRNQYLGHTYRVRGYVSEVVLSGTGHDWCKVSAVPGADTPVISVFPAGRLPVISRGEPVEVTGKVFSIFNNGPGMMYCQVKSLKKPPRPVTYEVPRIGPRIPTVY